MTSTKKPVEGQSAAHSTLTSNVTGLVVSMRTADTSHAMHAVGPSPEQPEHKEWHATQCPAADVSPPLAVVDEEPVLVVVSVSLVKGDADATGK